MENIKSIRSIEVCLLELLLHTKYRMKWESVVICNFSHTQKKRISLELKMLWGFMKVQQFINPKKLSLEYYSS